MAIDGYTHIFVYDDGARVVKLNVLREPLFNERTQTWSLVYAVPTGSNSYREAVKRVGNNRLIEIREAEQQ